MERWRKLHGRRVNSSPKYEDTELTSAQAGPRGENTQKRGERTSYAVRKGSESGRPASKAIPQKATPREDSDQKTDQGARKTECQVLYTYGTFEHSSPTISPRQIEPYECESFKQRQYVEFLVANSTNWCALTNLDVVKNKRNEKAAKFSVPLPKVRGIAEEEMFKVVKTGKKTAKKGGYFNLLLPTALKLTKLRMEAHNH